MPLSRVKTVVVFFSAYYSAKKMGVFLKGRAVNFVDQLPRCRSTA